MPLKGVWFYIQKLLKLVGYSLELAGHHCDFVLYKLTGKNVGQYGLSEHTDINPIMVRGTATAPETAQVEEDGRTTENRLFVDTVSRRSQSTEQGQSI